MDYGELVEAGVTGLGRLGMDVDTGMGLVHTLVLFFRIALSSPIFLLLSFLPLPPPASPSLRSRKQRAIAFAQDHSYNDSLSL